MYSGGVTFNISKSFGSLQLVPEPQGLRIYYVPVVNGVESPGAPGSLNLVLPLEAVGGIWATTKAFLYGVESLDENVILQGHAENSVSNANPEAGAEGEADTLFKLYRDKPRGQQGKLSGDETCWLRIVTGRTEEERRRIKLGPRDLMCIELACNAVFVLAGQSGNHRPTMTPAS